MSRRTIALVVAIVLAAVATVALISYVRGLEDKAFEGAETVEVFVASDIIPAGTAAEFASSKNLFQRQVIPRKVLADGAVSDLGQIAGKVAAVNIVKGEQIIAVRFVTPGQVKGVLPIPADRQAVSVEVAIPPGVAGFVQPGDHISILAQISVPRGEKDETRVQYLLQDIEVLAIGQRVVTVQGQEGGEQNQQQGQVLATLALRPAEVEKLVFAKLQGQLYFTLLPKGQKPSSTTGRTKQNAFQ